MFSRRGLSRVEDDKLHASFRPFGSSRHGGALVKTVPAGHVISAWPKSEELSAWIFWGTGEFENGARSYIFITLKRLREYGNSTTQLLLNYLAGYGLFYVQGERLLILT